MNITDIEMPRRYRAYDSYVHANHKGTGSACNIELHPAHGDKAGSIFLQLAMQSTVGSNQGGVQVFPTFDWANKIVIKLDRTDLSQILQVLRGIKESVGNGKGIFHRSARANTIIKFAHQLEPRQGYFLSVSRKTNEGELRNAWFVFDFDEAFTLKLALEQSMMYICFGIPEVFERAKPRPLPIPMSQMMQTDCTMPQTVPQPVQNVATLPNPPVTPVTQPSPETEDGARFDTPEFEPVLKVSGDPF